MKQRFDAAIEVRERESSEGVKRKRRIRVTKKEAENGLQRTAKQSSRSETVKNAKQNNRNGKQDISE